MTRSGTRQLGNLVKLGNPWLLRVAKPVFINNRFENTWEMKQWQ